MDITRLNNELSRTGEKIRYLQMLDRALRSWDPSRRKTKLPGPLILQIQTTDLCNGSCDMCPYSYKEKSDRANLMDRRLYVKILEELKNTGSVCNVIAMLQNEPLTDSNVHRLISDSKNILGSHVHTNIVTNGTLLSPSRADELIEAGLDTFTISIDAFCEQTYRSIRKGHDYNKMMFNVQSLLNRRQRPMVVVKFMKLAENTGEEKAFLHYWKKQGASVWIHESNNRAGTLDGYEKFRRNRPGFESGSISRMITDVINKTFSFCLRPFFMLEVLQDGRVILCNNDWNHEAVAGDLSKQSLDELWNGDVMNSYRHMLYTSIMDGDSICSRCSYSKGHFRNSD